MEYEHYDKETIGNRLKWLRDEEGKKRGSKITQEEISREIGVDRSNYVKWENGSVFPRTEYLIELCKYYKCSIGFLFGDYEGKTLNTNFIMEKIGLTEEAIDRLIRINIPKNRMGFLDNTFYPDDRQRFLSFIIQDFISYLVSNLEGIIGAIGDLARYGEYVVYMDSSGIFGQIKQEALTIKHIKESDEKIKYLQDLSDRKGRKLVSLAFDKGYYISCINCINDSHDFKTFLELTREKDIYSSVVMDILYILFPESFEQNDPNDILFDLKMDKQEVGFLTYQLDRQLHSFIDGYIDYENEEYRKALLKHMSELKKEVPNGK